MKVKQKIFALVISIAALTMTALPVNAQEAETAPTQTCGGADTAIISCTQSSQGNDPENNGVWGVLLIALNIMTAGVGIAAVGGIVWGAIMYTSAGDSAEQVKKAKEVIRNVILGLVAYGLMYLVLNYLIPGGVFE